MRDIKSLLYSTVHRNKKTVEQIADETGISKSYLYRACLPTDESGVKFPLEYLVPVMKSTKNFELLTHIARMCGFILVKVPRVAGKKEDEIDLIEQYQDVTTKAVRALRKFFTDPEEKAYRDADAALFEVMQHSAQAGKYIKKSFTGQLEMEL